MPQHEKPFFSAMGKDREVKPPPASVPPAVELGPDGKPKRPPKGHKQKGAGTVIVAKPPVVTGDGIVLKPHERLPSQLLMEYCQREKRPNPKYFPNPLGGNSSSGENHRLRVLLEDGKNDAKNLTFSPNQGFGSDSVARDFAALLALYHFCKTLPLERKMPEPYSTTWTTMLNNEKLEAQEAAKAARQNSKTSTAAKPTAVAATSPTVAMNNPAVVENKKLSGSSSNNALDSMEKPTTPTPTASQPTLPPVSISVPQLDRNTADWLCDKCGNQNFATLASGAVRLKCFKCQTTKGAHVVLVASVNAAFKASGDGNNAEMKMKAAPTAVVNLKSANQYASRQEQEQLKLEQQAARKRKASYFDALKRANKPMPVYLSATLRKMIEEVLGVNKNFLSNNFSNADEDETLTLEQLKVDYEEMLTFSEDSCELSAEVQLELLRDVVNNFVSKGFKECDVVNCLQLLLLTQYSEEIQEKLEHAVARYHSGASKDKVSIAMFNSPQASSLYVKVLMECCLAQLCLQLDETSLPAEYDPRKRESGPSLSVFKKSDASLSGVSSVTAKLVSDSVTADDLSEDLVNVFDALRLHCWTAADCKQALLLSSTLTSDNDAVTLTSLAILSMAALLMTSSDALMHLKLVESVESKLFSAAAGSSNDTLCEEIESLEAIYGEQFSVQRNGCFTQLTLKWDADLLAGCKALSSLSDCSISLLVPHGADVDGNTYPVSVPVVVLHSSSDLTKQQKAVLSDVQLKLCLKAAELRGECMLFQLYAQLNDVLSGLDTKSSDNSVSIALTRIEKYFSAGAGNRDISLLSSTAAATTTAVDDESAADTRDDTTTQSDSTSSRAASKGRKGTAGGGSKSGGGFWTRSTGSNSPARLASGKSSAEYSAMQTSRQALPAWSKRSDFLDLYQKNRGLVITGETGCGKTTQIPQYIHEQDVDSKIIVCQPRRLAAIGVATRIAEEMCESVGETVGYMVKGDSKVGKSTKIVFCTYGVLLRRLQDDPTLAAIDCVILDEVHERGVDSDFTLALLMTAAASRSDLKVLLMSATIATDRFASFLASSLQLANTPSVPVVFIPGCTFPVTEYYKGDFEEIVANYRVNNINARADVDDEDDVDGRGNSSRSDNRIGGPKRKGDLDYDLLVKLVMVLCGSGGASSSLLEGASKETTTMLSRASGSILIFVPGVPEITKLLMLLQSTNNTCGKGGPQLHMFPLHGNLSPSEQKKVFHTYGRNEIKIIVATNVAEASITIPDVTVVIDTCRVKQIDFDVELQSSQLVSKFAAQDSLLQRRGRAGRVSKGRCFRMITIGTYNKLAVHGVPEMLRTPLDSVILQVKSMLAVMSRQSSNRSGGDGGVFQGSDSMLLLSRCMDPPAVEVVRASEQQLVQINALDAATAEITPLGRHLAALPCSPRVGRLLIYGALLGCAFPSSCVAACLSNRSPFISSNDPEVLQKLNSARDYFGAGMVVKSDYNVIVVAMQQFLSTKNQRSFCKQYALSFERMIEIKQTQADLLDSLVDVGYISSVRDALSFSSAALTSGSKSINTNNVGVSNRNSHKSKLLAAVYCAGLYPQLAKVLRPPQRFEEVMGSAMEKSTDAKELKFYIPEQVQLDPSGGVNKAAASVSSAADASGGVVMSNGRIISGSDLDIHVADMQRVFLHPSTINFKNVSFRSSNFVLYGERQLVTFMNNNSSNAGGKSGGGSAAGDNYKLYLRDTTEVTAYALLFFGGKLEADFLNGIVTIDNWIRFAVSGRIVALIQALRKEFDKLLERKVTDPDLDINDSPVLEVACRLLETDGL